MKSIHMELVRVTEAASVAASAQVGRGDKLAADGAATVAALARLNTIKFSGEVVIGEGKKDGAPGLFSGDRVGSLQGKEPEYDIAIDVLEGTTPTAKGGYEAMSVIAVGYRGCLFRSEAFYMKKLAVGPQLSGIGLSVTDTATQIAGRVSDHTGKPLDRVTFCVLDRPRHADLIAEIRSLGCRIKLISDCDVSGAIATCMPDSGIDVYLGVGGAPEGVISAAAIKCMRGNFQGIFDDDVKVYGMEDLAKGDVVFCATGVTNGSLLRGVRYPGGKAHTHSVLMRSESGTVRWIDAEHGN